MTKAEFLFELGNRLYGLPQEDVSKTLEYYAEMIDERIEDGIPEEEAVAGIGALDDVVSDTLGDIPLPRLIKTSVKQDHPMETWKLVLLILGAPLWFGLLVAALALAAAAYITLWTVVAVFYIISAALFLVLPAGIVGLAIFAAYGKLPVGLFGLGGGLICGGLAILFFHLSVLLTKGAAALSKQITLAIKRCFVRKEASV